MLDKKIKEAEFKTRKAEHEERLATLDAELKSDQDALAKLEEVAGVLSSLREGTARGRPDKGVEGAGEKAKSAAAAVAVAVADTRAAGAAEVAILEAEEAGAEPPEAAGPETEGAETRWREAVQAAKPAEAIAGGDEETAETATEEAPAEAEPAEEAADSSAESIVESPADAAAEAEGDDYLDDLEFLESLSMDEVARLDAVSAMLEDESVAEGDRKGTEESR